MASIDDTHRVLWDGEVYSSVTGCDILSPKPLCVKCSQYAQVLHTNHARWLKKSVDQTSKFTNNRYLTSPQKTRKIKHSPSLAIGSSLVQIKVRIMIIFDQTWLYWALNESIFNAEKH